MVCCWALGQCIGMYDNLKADGRWCFGAGEGVKFW